MTKAAVLKAIRAKCLGCVCDQANEVRDCPCDDCPLYPFRFGKDPQPSARGYARKDYPDTDEQTPPDAF